MNITLSKINKVNTLEELNSLGLGNVHYDIGYRGGGVGLYASNVAEYLKISTDMLPRYVGASCNYLGGGIRGSITSGGYNDAITGRNAKVLDAISEACKRVYLFMEGDMNDEEYEDGETNWDAMATKSARNSGIVSAY